MKVTKKGLLALSAALVGCIAATLLLTYAGTGNGETEQRTTYYFTNYSSADALMAASIENDSGSVLMVGVKGTYLVSSDYQLQANAKAIQALFEEVYQLPLKGLLEGASSQDPQYGLTEPQATVMLEDVNEDGLIFLIGGQAPGGDGYYTCLSGDDRVFLMSSQYAELFLADVANYYNLSLYPSLEDGGMGQLSAITVRRDGKTAWQLERVAYLQDSGLAYFTMTEPVRLLIGTTQFTNHIQSSLEALAGTRLVPEVEDLAAYGLTEDAPTLTLTYDDGTTATIQVGAQEGSTTYVMSVDTGMVVTVPSGEISFIYDSPADVVGKNLLSLNLNAISSVKLNGRTYTLSGSGTDLSVTADASAMDAGTFQDTVFKALNSISIQGTYEDGIPTGEHLLEVRLQTRIGDEAILLDFYEIDSRRCAIAVNGTAAFWCNTVAVNTILSAAG